MLSMAERLNIAVSCVTMLMLRRKLSCVTVLVSVPSMLIVPPSVS